VVLQLRPAHLPAADHPSIQKLESTITALTTEAEGIQAKGATKYSALQKQDEAIIELKTRIKIEGDLADEALKDRLALAEDRRGILADQLESLGREFRSVNARLEDKKSQREAVRADAEAEGQRQKAAQAKAQEFNSEYPQRIDALIFKAADDLGVPDDPEIREDLWETANSKLMAKLFHLGKDVEITAADELALVRGYVERFAKTHGFASKAKFAGTSKEKAKVASRIVPGQPLVPRKTPNLTPGLVDDAVAKDPKLMAARARMERFASRIGA
jgi:DNA repair exonuclease SbcCD ATPase subunit